MQCPGQGPVTGGAAAKDWTTADPDHVDEIADEITTLAAHIHAATHRLLTLLREFDGLKGWEREGHRSCAHWLAFRTGIDLGAAREKVRAARALEELPRTSAAMERGALSFAKVRALTRVATAENEGVLLELARGSTAAELERMVRGWRLEGKDEADRQRIRHAARSLSVFPGDDGMYVVRGRLTPEVGALLMRAVEAAADALFKRETESEAEAEAERAAGQRRADALGLLAERAMVAGLGGAGHGAHRAGLYQVLLHVDAETLAEGGGQGRSELEDGTRVSAETSRRIACDASVVEVRHGARGQVLDVGRRRRTIPPAMRRALEARDRGCRFPGCGSRFTEAHHVRHWADGGATKLENLVLLCRHHHRLLHEEGYRLELNAWRGGSPVYYDARGLPVPERPPVADVGPGAAAALVRANTQRGVRPGWDTASCRWMEGGDVPLAVVDRAEEAA
jgi:hypothetical protein